MPETKASAAPKLPHSGRNATIVGFAILLSRIAGLLRERIFAHYFGNSVAADAFKAALRIPNLLQNLLGEGVLSASFIPVYARLRAEGDDVAASRVASTILSLLTFLLSLLVLAGIVATPWLIDAIAPGFEGEKRDVTIHLVRILFPGIGLLVVSAWCLGVLNSHRKFFLSYVAPVIWNLTQIVTMIAFGQRYHSYDLSLWLGYGAVLGSALQLASQLPSAIRLAGGFRVSLSLAQSHVREVLRNLGPAVMGRGVVQISAYIDSILASFLPNGAVSALAYTQILYTLPISMFGMAISAAELPEMASVRGDLSAIREQLVTRLATALNRMAFFIVPTAVGFLALGDVISALVFQTGRFTYQDARLVWVILAGATVGLGSVVMGRLYSSTFYALRDTRTPLRFALLRIALSTLLGAFCALALPQLLGYERIWGAAGLTLSSGIAGGVEFLLLRRALHARIGQVPFHAKLTFRLWVAAFGAAIAGIAAKYAISAAHITHPVLIGCLVLAPYGITYAGLCLLFRIDTAMALGQTLKRRLSKR